MLYIKRKKGESIIINNTIEITVIEASPFKVNLGCTFPAGASILRKELYDKIMQQNAAASVTEDDLDEASEEASKRDQDKIKEMLKDIT